MTYQDARKLSETKQDTHMRTLDYSFMCIDGSVHGQFTMVWYCENHKVGSFANVSVTSEGRNTEYVILDVPDALSFSHPYDWDRSRKSYELTGYKKRISLRTTKFVRADGEFIIHYGNS